MGWNALDAMTTASYNTVVGSEAAISLTTGDRNVGVGRYALQNLTTAHYNTAVGMQALQLSTTAHSNTAVGYNAGDHITTGHSNVVIGYGSDLSVNTGDNQVVVGAGLSGKGNDTTYTRGGNGAFHTGNTTTWSTSSDRRIKKNIVDNTVGLSIINQLNVRNFEYKTEDEITTDSPELTDVIKSAVIEKPGIQIGVIAQELEEICSSCVKTQNTGIKTVDTDPLIWHLINAVKELSAEVNALKAK
jgi:hypothetical protein